MSIRKIILPILESAQASLNEFRVLLKSPSTVTAIEIFRPELKNTPPRVRNILEPMVAATSLATLVFLAIISTGSFVTLLICSGAIYILLTQIFGLELELDPFQDTH